MANNMLDVYRLKFGDGESSVRCKVARYSAEQREVT